MSPSHFVSSLFFPERIHEADDPILTAGVFAVVLPCVILKALSELCYRFLKSVDGLHRSIRAHVITAHRTERRLYEVRIHTRMAVRAGDEVPRELFLILRLLIGGETLFFFLETFRKSDHLGRRLDTDLVLHRIRSRDTL